MQGMRNDGRTLEAVLSFKRIGRIATPLLHRHTAVLQLVPVGEVRREQFGRPAKALIEEAPELGRVVHGLRVGVFRDGKEGKMPARRPCRDSFGQDPPP
jgi:hypothetical protein